MYNMNMWIDKLEADRENWILYEESWLNYFKKLEVSGYTTDFLTYGNDGFILIRIFEEPEHGANIYLDFAYVDSRKRQQGVLKKVFKKLQTKYKGQKIYLNSLDETSDKVWTKLGFKMIKYYESPLKANVFLMDKLCVAKTILAVSSY